MGDLSSARAVQPDSSGNVTGPEKTGMWGDKGTTQDRMGMMPHMTGKKTMPGVKEKAEAARMSKGPCPKAPEGPPAPPKGKQGAPEKALPGPQGQTQQP